MAGQRSDLLSGAEVGGSAFAQVTAWIYWFIVLAGLTIVTSLPGFVVTLFLDRSVTNLPLLLLCLAPIGPAAAAQLFAWRRREVEGLDLSPARRFWRGYRLNLGDTLRWWLPYLLILALLAFVGLNLGAIGWPPGLVWAFLGLGLLVTLLAGQMMVVTALFDFRTRDVLRLGTLFLVRHWRTTLGDAALLVAIVLLVRVAGEWTVAIASSVIGWWWLRLARPTVNDALARFVVPAPAEESPGEASPDEPDPQPE